MQRLKMISKSPAKRFLLYTITLASLPVAPWPAAASRVYVSVQVAFKPALLTVQEHEDRKKRASVEQGAQLQVATAVPTDAGRALTDTGLDLLVSVLEDDVGILLAYQIVVLQEFSRDPADSKNLTAGCHYG